jgi:hypothetical protein
VTRPESPAMPADVIKYMNIADGELERLLEVIKTLDSQPSVKTGLVTDR